MAGEGIHVSILENMREGVLCLDMRGEIITFNPAAEEILGHLGSEVVGQPFAKVFLEVDGSDDLVQAVLDAIYDGASVQQKRISLPTPSGDRILSMTTSFLKREEQAESERHGGVITVFSDITETERLQETVRTLEALRGERLVRAFRERGHVLADLDPLGFSPRDTHPELTPEYHGIASEEMARPFSLLLGSEPVVRPLGEILEELRRIYCGPVGVQYMHIDDLEVQRWIQERLEDRSWEAPLSRDEQLRILRKLMDAEAFEVFVDRNFRGSKRFSLEGAETLIPLLDQAFETAANMGVEEVVMGMSHRGRLNAIVNLFETPAREVLQRFEQLEDAQSADPTGDVRFHLGLESSRRCYGGSDLRLSLCFNPSHLEIVGPVVLGRVRARQEQRADHGKSAVLPMVVHGDAAFAGQGIVQEQLNLSRLAGYETGGTVHVILNNQIGFTTEPHQGRSTQYASDVARMLQIPVFHVNGEQPDAVHRVIRLALEFRQRWQRDVVIDMYCFRRHGHMEQDNPELTQPLLYEEIQRRPPIHETYTANLVELGQLSSEEAREIRTAAQQALDTELEAARKSGGTDSPGHAQEDHGKASPVPSAPTASKLSSLLRDLSSLPDGFTPHPKASSLLRRRHALASKGGLVDWATAEILAYGTMLSSGIPVRLSGQDAERGTFGHRHAVVHDSRTGETYTPLASLPGANAPFTVHNSPLTESAVLAFEFGYSLECQEGLVIWEAQFGDFANVAQVVIDQFIVSSEAKWHQSTNLCLFLPHGLEGQGPEHSSARPERFLQLCASENITVATPTTAGQLFHLLRRQAHHKTRRPAIIFTPKKLLSHRSLSSPLEDLCEGQFEPILCDGDISTAERVLLCTGTIGLALVNERDARQSNAAVIRLEQLYPFPSEQIRKALEGREADRLLVWVQEEPENMGAWAWVRDQLREIWPDRPIHGVTRPESATPATGSFALHQEQHSNLVNQAFSSSSSELLRKNSSGDKCEDK